MLGFAIDLALRQRARAGGGPPPLGPRFDGTTPRFDADIHRFDRSS